jgi:hypothetical protein
LRAPLHAAFLRFAALPTPPADVTVTLFRYAREAVKAPAKPTGVELLALKFRHGLTMAQISTLFSWKPQQAAQRFHEALRAFKPSGEAQ